MNQAFEPSGLNDDHAMTAFGEFRDECRRRELRLSFAICDVGGNIILSHRMVGAQLGSLALAVDKAYTAVAFEHPTSAWAESSTPGHSDWGLAHTLGGRVTVFPGGVPIFRDGQLVGGIGVSGTKATTDEEIATAVVHALGCEVHP
jgi:uncharacterized protein GlcG (DUF336 family)